MFYVRKEIKPAGEGDFAGLLIPARDKSGAGHGTGATGKQFYKNTDQHIMH